jgi:ATP-binding cassette subfamily B (MDR/TAP) protein 1
LAISQPLGFLLLETTAILASVGTALFFSWKLALVIFATFPIAAGIFTLISRGVGPAIERQKRELSRASKYASTAVSAINTVQAFNGEDQEVWQYFLTAKAITKYYLIQARSNALQFGVIKFSAVMLYVSGFWYGLYLVTHGLTVGHVLTTFISCAYAMQAVEIVLPQFLVLAKGMYAGETLKSFMAEIQDGRTTKEEDGDLRPDTCPGDIEVNDVSPRSLSI